jgi:hypothetical protein
MAAGPSASRTSTWTGSACDRELTPSPGFGSSAALEPNPVKVAQMASKALVVTVLLAVAAPIAVFAIIARTSPSAVVEPDNGLGADTWEMRVPAGWIVESRDRPAEITGPAGQVARVSSVDFSDVGSEERAATRARLQEVHLRALGNSAPAEGDWIVTKQLSHTRISEGVDMFEVAQGSAREAAKLTSFVVLGPRASILVTIDSPQVANGEDEWRKALSSIRWF